MTSFTMRAILAGSSSAGTNLGLVIAQQVIYSVGFFGLLYSAYTLVLDRYAGSLSPLTHTHVDWYDYTVTCLPMAKAQRHVGPSAHSSI